MEEDWITTTEACQISGYTADHIRRLIKTEQINGHKFGPIWQVSRNSLLVYLQRIEKEGERRGPKTHKIGGL